MLHASNTYVSFNYFPRTLCAISIITGRYVLSRLFLSSPACRGVFFFSTWCIEAMPQIQIQTVWWFCLVEFICYSLCGRHRGFIASLNEKKRLPARSTALNSRRKGSIDLYNGNVTDLMKFLWNFSVSVTVVSVHRSPLETHFTPPLILNLTLILSLTAPKGFRLSDNLGKSLLVIVVRIHL